MEQFKRVRGKFSSFADEESIFQRIKEGRKQLVKSRKGRLAMFIVWVIVFGLVATGELYIIRTWHPFIDTLEKDVPIWEIFFSVFGLTYAILVGLIIVEAHRRWRELSSTIQREINAIVDIGDFLRYFKNAPADDAPRQEVIEALLNYLQTEIVADWWRTQKDIAERRHGHRQNVLRVIDAVAGLEPKDAIHHFALEAIIRKVSEMTSSRNERIEVMRQGLNRVFYGLLFLMSAIIVTGFCLLGVQDWWLGWLLVFTTAVSLCALFLLVYDLDHPVQGFWNIGEEIESNIKSLENRFTADIGKDTV